MTGRKRLFDIVLALVLVILLFLPFLGLCLWLLLFEGRPLFYVSERMTAPDKPFALWKLRTMRPSHDSQGVSGGDKADRITPMGRILRRSRLDELPQLWNILRGDMSFVGPRPPLRAYVERFPDLYAEVLRSRPGVTGLASLHFHRHEERILAQCLTKEETDKAYCRRCVPRKAKIDLIYQARQSMVLDLWILGRTALRVFGK